LLLVLLLVLLLLLLLMLHLGCQLLMWGRISHHLLIKRWTRCRHRPDGLLLLLKQYPLVVILSHRWYSCLRTSSRYRRRCIRRRSRASGNSWN
jgi:hypothetical protein